MVQFSSFLSYFLTVSNVNRSKINRFFTVEKEFGSTEIIMPKINPKHVRQTLDEKNQFRVLNWRENRKTTLQRWGAFFMLRTLIIEPNGASGTKFTSKFYDTTVDLLSQKLFTTKAEKLTIKSLKKSEVTVNN